MPGRPTNPCRAAFARWHGALIKWCSAQHHLLCARMSAVVYQVYLKGCSLAVQVALPSAFADKVGPEGLFPCSIDCPPLLVQLVGCPCRRA